MAKRTYTKSEKIAFRKGFFLGLKKSKTRKSSTRKRPIKKVVRKSNPNPNDYDWVLASRYANHMGRKYSLDFEEIQQNTKDHYAQMKVDKSFRDSLVKEYGFEL